MTGKNLTEYLTMPKKSKKSKIKPANKPEVKGYDNGKKPNPFQAFGNNPKAAPKAAGKKKK